MAGIALSTAGCCAEHGNMALAAFFLQVLPATGSISHSTLLGSVRPSG